MPVKKVSTLTRKEYELLYNKYSKQTSMGKPTGQMQEETQDLLDSYNQLFNWDYNEMCRFIENHYGGGVSSTLHKVSSTLR